RPSDWYLPSPALSSISRDCPSVISPFRTSSWNPSHFQAYSKPIPGAREWRCCLHFSTSLQQASQPLSFSSSTAADLLQSCRILLSGISKQPPKGMMKQNQTVIQIMTTECSMQKCAGMIDFITAHCFIPDCISGGGHHPLPAVPFRRYCS